MRFTDLNLSYIVRGHRTGRASSITTFNFKAIDGARAALMCDPAPEVAYKGRLAWGVFGSWRSRVTSSLSAGRAESRWCFWAARTIGTRKDAPRSRARSEERRVG